MAETVRMTNYIKEEVSKELLRHRFGEEYDALFARHQALVGTVYNDVYPKKIQEQMYALPSGWLPEDDDITVQIASYHVQLYFNGMPHLYELRRNMRDRLGLEPYPEEVKRRVTTRHVRGTAKVYEAGSKIAEEFEALMHDWDVFREKLEQAERAAKVAMSQATTVKKMKAIWPELAPYLLRFESARPTLPSLQLAELNSMFALEAA